MSLAVVTGAAVLGLLGNRFPVMRLQGGGLVHAAGVQVGGDSAPELEPRTRQVTMLAILAMPGSRDLDPRLAGVKTQLRKVLPEHGFKLIDVQSKRIKAGESITCDLGHGYNARTILDRSVDENGKAQVRCVLSHGEAAEFSKRVKTPLNQLFFYEHTLEDGARMLIGVGAR